MVRVDFESFTQAFNAWAKERFAPAPGEPLATVRLWRSEALGNSIKASVRDDDQSYQAFVSVVSAFSVAQGVVVGLETMRNQQTSEIKTVEVLLKTLQLKGVCFSLDALHTKKNSGANH
ncbi:MAG: hypothetical protein H7Z11_08740 [Verrucomicrobia bacterium]|nr:hypothetical protein [Leptolyngbya sp. ES-bin-22]